jgi:Flp pilus assembly protein TadG
MGESFFQRFRRRSRERRGNAMIEFSLCALPFFAIFFGIADVSMAVFLRSMLQSSVRDGVRFAITFKMSHNNVSCSTQTECVKKVVQANSLNFLNGANANLIQVRFYAPTNLSMPLTTADAGPGRTMPGDTQTPPRLLQYINQMGNLVEVSVVNFPWNWMVPMPGFMPGQQIRMTITASDVLQGYPIGATAPPTP